VARVPGPKCRCPVLEWCHGREHPDPAPTPGGPRGRRAGAAGRRQMRLATALADGHHPVRAALAAGELLLDQARVIVAALEALPADLEPRWWTGPRCSWSPRPGTTTPPRGGSWAGACSKSSTSAAGPGSTPDPCAPPSPCATTAAPPTAATGPLPRSPRHPLDPRRPHQHQHRPPPLPQTPHPSPQPRLHHHQTPRRESRLPPQNVSPPSGFEQALRALLNRPRLRPCPCLPGFATVAARPASPSEGHRREHGQEFQCRRTGASRS
jgi:hypothetical protein